MLRSTRTAHMHAKDPHEQSGKSSVSSLHFFPASMTSQQYNVKLVSHAASAIFVTCNGPRPVTACRAGCHTCIAKPPGSTPSSRAFPAGPARVPAGTGCTYRTWTRTAEDTTLVRPDSSAAPPPPLPRRVSSTPPARYGHQPLHVSTQHLACTNLRQYRVPHGFEWVPGKFEIRPVAVRAHLSIIDQWPWTGHGQPDEHVSKEACMFLHCAKKRVYFYIAPPDRELSGHRRRTVARLLHTSIF